MALQDIASPFTWGAGGARLTPEQIARQREVADALAKQGLDFSPVASPWQGAARVADALVAGIKNRRADRAESANATANQSLIASLLGGQGGSAFPAAPAQPGIETSAEPMDYPSQRVSQAFAASRDSNAVDPSTFFGPDVNVATLPAGMRNNNPGNIKFVGQNVPGIVGPSQNTDQGDPQAVFDSPVAGMRAAANLALRKNQGGKRTIDALIAGNGGWTPGNHQAAANIARTMGVGPNDPIDLSNPQQMQGFLRGLVTQEHGPASKLYPDSLIAEAIGSPAAAATQAMATGAVPAPPPQPVQVAQNVQPGMMSDTDALAGLGASPVAKTAAGGINPAIIQALSSPYADPQTRNIAGILLQQEMKQSDPSAQLDMRYKQAQIDHLENGGKTANYGQTPLMLTDPQNKMHMGQMSSGGGILIDGKTYGSLPEGWKVGTVSQSGSGGLSPEALDIVSTQYLAGDKSAIQGFSRSATMRAQLANAIAEKADAMGMDGKAIAAEVSAYGGNVSAQKAAGTRAAQVGMAASEANKMADIAVEASRSVPRGSLMAWNAIQNAVKTGTSSPEMAAFVTATTSLVNAYARAVSPLGAPTDAMRQHAEQMLNTAQSPQAYEAVINQMKKEMGAALNAPSEISEGLKKQVTGAGPETSTQDGAANPPMHQGQTDLPAGVSEEAMQYTMKEYGLTRDQVLDRLKKAKK